MAIAEYSIIKMDAKLQEKKKGQKNFRSKIDHSLITSPFTNHHQQLSLHTLTQIIHIPFFHGACTDGKINVHKLSRKATENDPKYTQEQLSKALGGRKEMKLADLHQILQKYELAEFNLKEQMISLLFTENKLSLSKMDQVMRSLGQPSLTAIDKQILIECFDYDGDGDVGLQDIQRMLEICRQGPAKHAAGPRLATPNHYI